MIGRGTIRKGTVELLEPVDLPDGSAVDILESRLELGCFDAIRKAEFDPAALEALRRDLTPEQFEALKFVAESGGPDVDRIARHRLASLQ